MARFYEDDQALIEIAFEGRNSWLLLEAKNEPESYLCSTKIWKVLGSLSLTPGDILSLLIHPLILT